MLVLRLHDLRHFAGTMATAAGASTKEVMGFFGFQRGAALSEVPLS
jgi:hypothetical protein